MEYLKICNGTALVGDRLEKTDVLIADGKFTFHESAKAIQIDATGCYVLPGIIDIHGDGFERVIEPRPGVSFNKKLALHETDKQMVSNGITTAFHGLGVSWEPGGRAIDESRVSLTPGTQCVVI